MKQYPKYCLGISIFTTMVFVAACKEESGKVKISIKEDGSNLCAEYAEVACYNIFECCVGAELEARLGVEITTDRAACENDMSLECEYYMATLQHSMDLGRISPLSENLNACFEQYLVGDDGCFPVVSEVWPACDADMFKGNQKVGQACLIDEDCVAEAYCGANRMCREKGGKNDPCMPSGSSDPAMPCKAAYYCGYDADIDETSYVCLTLTESGDECSSDDECETGMICISDEEGEPRVCTSLKKIGDACEHDYVCKSGFCLPGVCDDGRICDDENQCSGTCSVSGAVCTSDAHCGGQCSVSDTSCTSNDSCIYGECEGTGDMCLYSQGCEGTCAVSGYYCYDDSYCDTADPSDVCDAPECVRETCVSDQTCEGTSPCEDRACAENFRVLDNCQENPFGIPFD